MPDDPLIGSKLSNFRIDRLLGRGGMARVYYAWDERLQRPVALKVIDERYRGNPAYTERFIREASFVATWRHPNILQIYFAGEEDGLYYYVMEYIPGRDLGNLLGELKAQQKLLPVSEVLRIANAVADALDYAHRQGVIHRDVKPSNVIMADDGRIVLADFGLAMNVSMGTVGGAFGSPHYISPEQARNSSLAVPQSDLYSLGVMLYELLTGSLPFDDPSPTALIYQHLTQPPPPPRTLNPALSPAVEQVLYKALAKNPEERYPTGRDLTAALSTALDEGISATQAEPAMPQKTSPAAARPGAASPMPQPAYRLDQAQPFVPISPAGAPAATLLPPVAQNPPRTHSTGRWLVGCAGVLASLFLVGLLLSYGAAKLPGIPSLFAKPSSTATRPAATLPSTLAAVAAASTAAPNSPPPSSMPTATDTAIPTATETPTITLTATDTPTPTPTETPITQSVYFFVPKKTTALVVVNKTGAPLALKYLQIRNGSSVIQGDAWDAVTLNQGECILVVGDPRDAGKVGNLSCHQPAKPLHWTGEHTFWTSQFDILYLGQKAGTCTHLPDRPDGCTSNFPAPTVTPTPTDTPTDTPQPAAQNSQ